MKKFLSMLIILAILIGVWWVYGKVSVTETHMTAVSGEYEEAFQAKAVIIRNEYPIVSELKGTLQNSVTPGTRVTRYSNVGYVYSGNADEKVIAELSQVNERIAEFEKIQDATLLNLTDINEINAKITGLSNQIATKGRTGSGSEIHGLISEINMLIGRKRYLEGESRGENDLTELSKRKATLESKLSGKRMGLSAPVSGLYYNFVDGYEGVKISEVSTLTADKLTKIAKGESVGAETQGAICKVVDNSCWIVSVVTDKDTVTGLAEGQPITVRFTGSESQPVDARVHSFVYDGKKVIMNIEGTCYVDEIYNQRVCTVDIIKNTYKGLRIPSKAIVDGGEAGMVVYVRKTSGEKQKQVKVLCSLPDGTSIVKSGTDSEELLLYDEVIVKTKRK